MSAAILIASDSPLKQVTPPREYPLKINVDGGTIFDGDADDNFSLRHFFDYPDCISLGHVLELEWAYYTDGRAVGLIEYIKQALKHTDIVELWRVWLGGLDEVEERPIIKIQAVPIDELTEARIKELDSAGIWEKPREPRPTFRCIRVRK